MMIHLLPLYASWKAHLSYDVYAFMCFGPEEMIYSELPLGVVSSSNSEHRLLAGIAVVRVASLQTFDGASSG